MVEWPNLLSERRYIEVCRNLYSKHSFKGSPLDLYRILSPEEKVEWLEAVLMDAGEDLSYAHTIISNLSSRFGSYGSVVLRREET